MNVHAVARNWGQAKRLFRRPFDRLKYLYWIYSAARTGLSARELNLRVDLREPLGQLDLVVRCNGGSDAFIFSEVFQHRYYELDLPFIPQTILDVGANIGFTTLFFARRYPEANIACVEPVRRNLSILQKNLVLNRVPAKVIPKALSVARGTVLMQMSEKDYGHKIANGQCEDGAGTLEVCGVSISALMADLHWSRIGLLKLDIEGYEKVLLKQHATWLRDVDAMCIECHEGFGEDDLIEIATVHGFTKPHELRGLWLLTRESSPELMSTRRLPA